MRIEEPPRRRRLVSLTPLIDVVFILLIFFMLASTFVEWQAFDVDAPPEDAAPEDMEDEPLQIRVKVDGYEVEDESVDLTALRGRLERLASEDPERRIQLLAAEGVPVRPVMRALDATAVKGLENVAVIREERD